MLAGETDFLLKIVAADWDSYQHFLSGQLTAAPNVTHVKSALVLRVSKAAPASRSREVDAELISSKELALRGAVGDRAIPFGDQAAGDCFASQGRVNVATGQPKATVTTS